MRTTPTAALVEEAETHTTCDKCGAAIVKYSDFTGLLPTEDGMRSRTPLVCERTQELRRAEAERDEAKRDAEAYKRQTKDVTAKALELMQEVSAKLEQAEVERDELRAQVWGLICAGSNMAERKQHFRGLWETALEAGLKLERSVSDLTATRDLLNGENARLQARVATLELLRRGGK